MSNFHGAHDFTSETINVVQANNYHVHQGGSASRCPIPKLEANIATGALYNSKERYDADAPKCFPETRVAVQEEILSWIAKGDENSEPTKILWLTGPAGAGKTAITGSVAETCNEHGLLAASFFFSSVTGSASRRSKRCFVTTLAYQLLQHDNLQPMEEPIFTSLQRNPAILETRLKDQLESFILAPLRALGPRGSTASPKVVIIDGLDECLPEENPMDSSANDVPYWLRKERDLQEILSVLLQAASDPAFPFRILLASRPEAIIEEYFRTLSAQKVHRRIFLDGKYEPDKDIALFLDAKFSEIRRRYGLPHAWPSDADIKLLVENASGQFIYAATVIRFIDNPSAPPPELLERAVKLIPAEGNSSPFAKLDALYRYVLNSTPKPALVVLWLLTIRKGLRGFQTEGEIRSALFCRQFLESVLGEGEHLLRNMASLMSIPPSDDNHSPYRLYHKSLMDFLEEPSRHRVPGVGDWWDFFRAHYLQVLKDKAPHNPLPDEEGKVFLDRFMAVMIPFSFDYFGNTPYSVWKLYNGDDGSDLRSSDARWWAHQLLERKDPVGIHKDHFINGIYYSVHASVSTV
ncbi:hypothetical protein D9611_004087 [Ephemerocybe angulata]|uniref:NACHT domain-containing protein n=1 Tax=Ephemerocybe angulata TaxID=980116 RepID=A0A8H5F5S5_9AGAR|nr:hypothetical protein D9611_004087 [Tulosesus angulatus]